MIAETFRTRVVSGCLATMLLTFGAVLADTTPLKEQPAASSIVSKADSAMTPLAPASGQAVVPWMSESLVLYTPAGMSPLKPADETRQNDQLTKAKPGVPDVPVPATVLNLRRAGGQ